jgi:glycosyltransferase involved in cell wall biosynthesis/SAM-dependent methyltransferase
MRILLVNKFHYLRGGAERAYFDTAEILRSRGHEVAFFSMEHPENEPTPWSRFFVSPIEYSADGRMGTQAKLRAAVRILWNREAEQKIGALMDEFRPDVVHFHNIYHQLSPSVIFAAAKRGIPTVMTLHDYKLISPNYSLFVHGKIWDHSSGIRCVLDRCVKDSRAKSLVCALEQWLHSALGIYGKIDAFVAPSRFLAAKFREHGFHQRISPLPQPLLPFPEASIPKGRGEYILFFGRLSPEKSVETLLRAVSFLGATEKLVIVGDGPDRNRLENRAREILLPESVSFLGAKYGEELEEIKRKAKAIVIPSEWYENMPYVLLESLASGVPVIAARIGGMTERIEDGKNGFLYEPGNARELAEKIRAVASVDRKAVADAALKSVADLRPEAYGAKLEELYADVTRKKRGSKLFGGLPEDEARGYYETEKRLATRLKEASEEERKTLYSELYDELFTTVPAARSYNKWEDDEETKARRAGEKMRLIRKYLPEGGVFVEIGPGDCATSLSAAEIAGRVYAVDVSREAIGAIDPPVHFSLALSDGTSVPVPRGSADVVYSAQLMEHLHPDDAKKQLGNIATALKSGGAYICITPNRLSGPHDISKYFSDEAVGFHLHEYSNRELAGLFREAGLPNIRTFVGGRGMYLHVPFLFLASLEVIANILPVAVRRKLFGNLFGLALFGIIMVGRKA